MSNDYGIKMSEGLFSVKSANPQQTHYSSRWANLKVYQVLSVNVGVTAGSPSGSASIVNPLSYPPFFIGYISAGNSSTVYRMANQTDLTVAWEQDTNINGVVVEYDIVNNRFNVSVSTSGAGTFNYNFRIVVFIDKVSGVAASVSSGGDEGIRVSNTAVPVKAGEDTAMSMTSEFRNLTVKSSGTADVSFDGVNYVPTAVHALGYVPIFICWFNPTGDPTWGGRYLNVPTTNSFNSVFQSVEAWSDTNALNFQTDHTAPTERFRYLIFNERLV